MISGIEISPSNKASCTRCHSLIKKGVPRGRENFKNGNYNGERYYCFKCSQDYLNEMIVSIVELQQTLSNEIDKHKDIMMVDEL